MLRYYFENTKDEEQNRRNRELFSGLAIEAAGERYTREMTSYPVIQITLKSAKQNRFEEAISCLWEMIAEEFERHENQVKEKLESPADLEKYMEQCGRLKRRNIRKNCGRRDIGEGYRDMRIFWRMGLPFSGKSVW